MNQIEKLCSLAADAEISIKIITVIIKNNGKVLTSVNQAQ